MRHRSHVALATVVSVIALLVLAATPALAHSHGASYTRSALVTIPGNALTSFDISWVDPSSQTYYLADRSNAGIDIIDARTHTYVGRVTGFQGFHGSNDTAGPNGVVVVHPQHDLWAGDGDSTVKVVDLTTNAIVATLSTGGSKRADEMAYDQKDDLLLVANDAEDVPFVTFIDVRSRTVLNRISFPDATNGIEQSVWDPVTHLFYLSLPQLGSDPMHGGIAVIDPRTRSLVTIRSVSDCQPAGLALGPDQHLLLGCSGDAIAAGAHAQTQVMDARSGAIVATIMQVGGSDEVWYDPGDKRYYLAARSMTSNGLSSGTATPVLGVIDATSNTWITNVATGPQSHSVAANPINNEVFVPLRGLGIGIYTHD